MQRYWLELAYGSVSDGLNETRQALSEWTASVTFLPIPSEDRPLGRERLALRALLGDPYTVRWLSSTTAMAAIKEMARRVAPSVSHFDTISLAQYRRCVTAGACTLGHHNVESHMILRRAAQERNRLKRWYFQQEGVRLRRYEKDHATEFDLHVTCSALDSARLLEIAGDIPVTDVPNGVDVEFFSPPSEPAESVDLAFVGTMNWYPNVDAMRFFASEVWPVFRELNPRSIFHLVGASPPEDLVALGRADPRFRVHGFVDDVRPILRESAVFVCPIRDGGGTKLKILDAFAMGCVVVAHPLAVEGIEAVDQQHFLAASTPTEFVKSISTAIEDIQARKRLSTAARRLACEKYSFSALGDRFSDVLESSQLKRPDR